MDLSPEHIVTFIIAGIVAFAIIMYVVLDGFDLGIGILFPWTADDEHRLTMINTITPVWDGNETWLVLGAAALYGGFPEVYSSLLPTLYLPIMLMLGGLVLRGVSFEFLHNSDKSRFIWVFSFSLGSTLAAFCQGVMLGTFVQGYTFIDGVLQVSDYQWLTPFSMATGIAVVFGYALLGSTWLVGKTSNALQTVMIHRAKILLIIVGICMVGVSTWTPFIDPNIQSRWFSTPNIYYLSLLPFASVITFFIAWRALNSGNERQPFRCCVLLFLLGYLGFAISIWPYLIPRQLTLWDAAGPYRSQIFVLWGLAVLLPVLIGYTIYSYWVFKGKVKADSHHY